jgi:hypothetical protein
MITNKKLIYYSSAFFAVIVATSLFFHFQVHISDALTLEVLPEFGIRISFWRVLFEPILGLLLFFNRSLYAIEETQILLYWVLAVFLITVIIKAILIGKTPDRKSFIVSQLVNLPLVTGLWFTVFVIILFIPFPNNTIENNSKNTILVNTHSHCEYSHDGLISQKGLWKWHKRNGFDAFFITEHNNHNATFDFVEAQRNNEFPINPLVMCGEEFSGTNHLSLLGLKEKFRTKGMTDSMVINLTRASNGAVIVNHWFDGEHMSLDYYKNLAVDGFEIANTATEKTYNREVYKRIKNYCESNQLIMNGGVDFHGYGNMCSLWNAFEIPDWHKLNPALKEEAILNIIKNRDQSKIKVLLYKDRNYYTSKNLWIAPPLTIFNYFRTLNFLQILSWAVWILLFVVFKYQVSQNRNLEIKLSFNRIISVKGFFSSIFLLVLGIVYFLKIKRIPDYTEMYEEYSTLLFYVGSVFLIYSGVVGYFRIFRSKKR